MSSQKKTIKRRKRTKWTKKQLNILYECWKNAETNKERIELVEEKLPKIPPLAALNKIRSLAKTDSKWISMSTRKKNQKEKEKLQIELDKERKKKEKEKKRKEREKKRLQKDEKKKERSKIQAKKSLKSKIKSNLKRSDFNLIEENIESNIFYCPKTQQFMNNISCIFRIFSEDYGFSVGSLCEKCNKMDEHIPIIKEVVKNARQKRSERNKASKGSGEDKEKNTAGTTVKAKKSSGNSKRTRREKDGRGASTSN